MNLDSIITAKDKFQFKEVNLINYFLECFDLMAQLKGVFSSDSFIITLIEMNVNCHFL